MLLPPAAERTVDEYLDAVDAAVPDLVEGFYVTGSVALGDFHPAISDVDAVALCCRVPTTAQLDALEAVHRPSRPQLDVLYVTGDDLRGDPAACSAPHSHEGKFARHGAFAANPVEWRTLQTKALAVRGPALAQADVWFDPDVLRRWNADNLDAYWRGRVEWMTTAEPTEAVVRWEYGLQWLVLGIPRLHHTISTLEVTSKTGAGHYALNVVDRRWHQVIETAIALRADRAAPLSASPAQLQRDAVELAAWLISDARAVVEL